MKTTYGIIRENSKDNKSPVLLEKVAYWLVGED